MTNMIRLSGIQRGDWPDVIEMQLHGEFRNYVPERTCHSDNEPPLLYDDVQRVFRCSECHSKVDLRYNRKPNYCPKCGAKVVE